MISHKTLRVTIVWQVRYAIETEHGTPDVVNRRGWKKVQFVALINPRRMRRRVTVLAFCLCDTLLSLFLTSHSLASTKEVTIGFFVGFSLI